MEITLLTIVLASIGWTLLLTASVIGAIFAVNSRFASVESQIAQMQSQMQSQITQMQSQITQIMQHFSLSSEAKND